MKTAGQMAESLTLMKALFEKLPPSLKHCRLLTYPVDC